MNPLYRQDTYLTDAVSPLAFATRTESGATGLCLRDLAFFPGGGGQPKETVGCAVEIRGESFGVVDLVKFKGDVLIVLDRAFGDLASLKKGEPVRQLVDRERRLKAARLHTLQHVVGASARRVLPGYESRGMTLSNYLTGGVMRFSSEAPPTGEHLAEIAETARAAIASDLPVTVEYRSSVDDVRETFGAAFRVDPSLVFSGNRLRTIVIGPKDAPRDAFDVSLCGGTHVRSLAEIGEIGPIETPFSGDAPTDAFERTVFSLAFALSPER